MNEDKHYLLFSLYTNLRFMQKSLFQKQCLNAKRDLT